MPPSIPRTQPPVVRVATAPAAATASASSPASSPRACKASWASASRQDRRAPGRHRPDGAPRPAADAHRSHRLCAGPGRPGPSTVAAARARALQTAADEALSRPGRGRRGVGLGLRPDQGRRPRRPRPTAGRRGPGPRVAQRRRATRCWSPTPTASWWRRWRARPGGRRRPDGRAPGPCRSARGHDRPARDAPPRRRLDGDAPRCSAETPPAGRRLRQFSDAADPRTRTFEARYVLEGVRPPRRWARP
jgi:hypothetical protein